MVDQIIPAPGASAESPEPAAAVSENLPPANPEWERIVAVIKYSGEKSINSFSKKLGLGRAERLYQIKKGNNRISIRLARTINARYPHFSVSWLLLGDEHNPVMKE